MADAFPNLPLHPDVWQSFLFRFFGSDGSDALQCYMHLTADFGTFPGLSICQTAKLSGRLLPTDFQSSGSRVLRLVYFKGVVQILSRRGPDGQCRATTLPMAVYVLRPLTGAAKYAWGARAR